MRLAPFLAAGLVLGLGSSGCTGHTREPRAAAAHVRWLVIAPHPDDEALIAGGLLARAAAHGEPVAVVVMTNGDYDCVVDGMVRQHESLRALASLGVPAERVHFLGYPDGSLAALGVAPLPPVRRIVDGACERGNTTYGTRGAPAPYTRESAVTDLARLVRDLAPDDVAITHPADRHPDHAATYLLFRDALDRLPTAPRVHRAVVHNGDCWPMSDDPDEPCPDLPTDLAVPTRALSGHLAGYVATERLPLTDDERHAKTRAIAAYTSQTRGSTDSYLFSFARSDEMFFPETFERVDGRWERRGDHARTTRAILATGPATLELEPYRVVIDKHEARLYREGKLHERWPLPHDLPPPSDEPCSLSVAPHVEEGNVDEIALACHRARVGISIAGRGWIDVRTRMP